MTNKFILFSLLILLLACKSKKTYLSADALQPAVVTKKVKHDTDDPAIWINKSDPSKSLIIGTDKDSDGALYVFNLKGETIKKVSGLKRPNNVDIAYNITLNNKSYDIAAVTERETNKLRILSLPDMNFIDNGGIEVFEGETERSPMGIALYTRPSDHATFAIVSRKAGPSDNYLWQYRLSEDQQGHIRGKVVRKFGQFSGIKEIESVAADSEMGYVYFSDEGVGIRKYYADPEKGNQQLALFGTKDFKSDIEGISIYKSSSETGYLIVSDQQANCFNIYPREGSNDDSNTHALICKIPFSTLESDGSDVTCANLGPAFPEGLFVAMSNGRVFQYYDWRQIAERIKH